MGCLNHLLHYKESDIGSRSDEIEVYKCHLHRMSLELLNKIIENLQKK